MRATAVLVRLTDGISIGRRGLWGTYQWLDRAPKGRNEKGLWGRHHDKYDKGSNDLGKRSTHHDSTDFARQRPRTRAFPYNLRCCGILASFSMSAEAGLVRALARNRWIVGTCLALACVFAWSWLFWQARQVSA